MATENKRLRYTGAFKECQLPPEGEGAPPPISPHPTRQTFSMLVPPGYPIGSPQVMA
ncbi:hypothetical protein SAMN05216359_11051 [Roseateles sp. YR242]|nr:hypothetical protein SAMN05216359_11051 [Roseateles sp. YR242]